MTCPRFLALLLPLAAAACLNLNDPINNVTPATVETTTFEPSLGVDVAASTRTQSGLYYRDITVGTGETISAGDSAGVYFLGSLSTGTAFDSVKAPSNPALFKVGDLRLIQGFEEGVVGMKVGGTRQLLIPPTIGFGFSDLVDQTTGLVVIPGNSVVVFTVDAVSRTAPTT
jgi:FKBP-type peptidyl-prolyl cis-trans isomerase